MRNDNGVLMPSQFPNLQHYPKKLSNYPSIKVAIMYINMHKSNLRLTTELLTGYYQCFI